jgi:hypothetical protein
MESAKLIKSLILLLFKKLQIIHDDHLTFTVRMPCAHRWCLFIHKRFKSEDAHLSDWWRLESAVPQFRYLCSVLSHAAQTFQPDLLADHQWDDVNRPEFRGGSWLELRPRSLAFRPVAGSSSPQL